MFPLPRRSRLTSYGFTLATLAAAVLVSWGASQVLNIQAPVLPFSLAVAAAAWFGGMEAGLLGTALGALMLFGVFNGLMSSMLAVQPGTPLLIAFCVVGVVLSVV